MDVSSDSPSVWWGSFALKEGEVGCWHVGPTHFWLVHHESEWRLYYQPQPDPLEMRASVHVPLSEEEQKAFEEGAALETTSLRFAQQVLKDDVTVLPALADRPMIVRPETPLSILPEQTVTLYVSTPLWVQFRVEGRLMTELPSLRPPDTWFGPSTREGELCYATRTNARLVLDHVPQRMNRAVTPLLVRNRGIDPLQLERVQLPVQHLTLYRSIYNFLWTSPVEVVRESDQQSVSIHIQPTPPPEASQPEVFILPRVAIRTTIINRIGGWFGLQRTLPFNM